MKSSIKILSLSLLILVTISCKQTKETKVVVEPEIKEITNKIPEYKPSDQELHDAIVAMDKKYFKAYNTCDLKTQASIYADDLEFYHDLGGLETDKDKLIKALKDNICDKVTRQLVQGSMEVYPIAGYGAVAEGYHTFFNKLEPDAPQKPSKFITIWKQTDAGWKMARIVSLH
jgi:ketosteroid isomerase-like protein